MRHLETLAQQIAARGIKHVFGIPGSGPSLHLLDALEKNGVRYHMTHFEGTAAIMAGAVGRLSGKSGVAISIKGPGLANMLPGLAVCHLDAWPIVSIAEAYPPQSPPEKSHKRLDHDRLVSGIAKARFYLSDNGPDFDSLSALAEEEVPGVVHLEINVSPLHGVPSEKASTTETVEPGSGDKIARLLENAKRPVVIAGTLAVRRRWHEKLNSLSLPVFSTAAAKGAVNELLPHAAGVYTGVGGPLVPEKNILPKADLVVGIGLRHNEVLAAGPFDRPSINVDPLGNRHSTGFCFDDWIEGTPCQTDGLFDSLSVRQWGLEIINKNLENLRARMLAPSFLPAHLYDNIAAHLKNEARLILDTGNFCTIGEHAWRVTRPEWYLAAGQGRYMGVSLPLGIGAAIYDSRVPTVVFAGDGGIGMFVSEIKLAVQNSLPILFVLMSDGYLGTIRGASLKKSLTQQPTTIHDPSWIGVMEGFGVPGVRIESLAALEKALMNWDQLHPLYLEARFDPTAYQSMTEGIR
jgi:acetolactate synthase-1/2/3 large subunit